MPLGEIGQVMACRAQGVPVLITGLPADHPDADAWLPDSAPPSFLVAVVSELIARARGAEVAPAEGVPWRRKTDMIVGHSLATRRLLHTVGQLAPSSRPVTISGEIGTGKALVAQALHYCGPRAGARLISIRCATVSDWAIEEDLLTGGTLVLDEVGDLAPPLQAKLLQGLEAASSPPRGAAPADCTVRLVATTMHDLESDVHAGHFLEGLRAFFAQTTIHLLPLRDRPEDIAPILGHHLALLARREGSPPPRVTPQALDRFLAHGWPGNVRELVETTERTFLMAEDGVIDDRHVVFGGAPISAERLKAALPSFRNAKSSFEHAYYSQLMRLTGGNISLAAKMAMKTRKEVYDALRRLGLSATDYRGQLAAEGE
jgi:DNA-binding NtrC family response regulator